MCPGDQQPRVTLASAVLGSVFAARALADQGWLSTYFSPLLAVPGDRPYLERVDRFRQRRVLPVAAGLPCQPLIAADLANQVLRSLPASAKSRFAIPDWLADRASRRRLGWPDIFHFHSGYFATAAELAARRGAVVVCDRWARYPGVEGHPEPRADRLAREFAASDFVIVNSEIARADFLARGWAEDQVILIPLGVDVERFAGDRPVRSTGPKRVLFVGQVVPRKGVDVLAQAMAGLDLDVQLRIVGHASASAMAQIHGVLPTARFTGPLGGDDLVEEFHRADVFVLPSRSDSFGLVVLEAMAAGLPVIVTSTTGAAPAVEKGDAGLVVPPDDSSALQAALDKLLVSEPLRQHYGANARAEAQQWSWQVYGERLVEAYRERLIPALARKRAC